MQPPYCNWSRRILWFANVFVRTLLLQATQYILFFFLTFYGFYSFCSFIHLHSVWKLLCGFGTPHCFGSWWLFLGVEVSSTFLPSVSSSPHSSVFIHWGHLITSELFQLQMSIFLLSLQFLCCTPWADFLHLYQGLYNTFPHLSQGLEHCLSQC